MSKIVDKKYTEQMNKLQNAMEKAKQFIDIGYHLKRGLNFDGSLNMKSSKFNEANEIREELINMLINLWPVKMLKIINSNYDKSYDVLRLYFASTDIPFSAETEEEFSGIYIDRNIENNSIISMIIFDYSKRNIEDLEILMPMIEWGDIKLV